MAKYEMLKNLRKMAMDMNGENMMGGDMQKVSVMAKDKEGLKKGLEKAEEVIENDPMSKLKEHMKESPEMEEEEDMEEEHEEMNLEEMSKEELLEHIKKMSK